MIASTIKNARRPLRTLLLAATVVTLTVACSSDDDDDDPGSNTGEVDGSMSLGTTTLDEAFDVPADGEPIDDGLDQIQADLLTRFGDADSTPFEIGDEDTVESLLGN